MAKKVQARAGPRNGRGAIERKAATVILVDDDAQVRRALTRLLRVHHLNVSSFERPSEVLLSRLPAANVVMLADIYMPEMTGVALCLELRARGVDMPTILITAHRDELAVLYGKQIRAIAVLFKPIEEKQLLEALQRALQRVID
jgi:FixJ family two-component response regulator